MRTTAELRADARSNRDQILAAAQLVFREQGVNVSMKEIADAAGVGVGTLYRRFPDRGALITAAAHSYLSALSDLAATAERESPDAWQALARLLRECAELRLGATASAIEPTLHADIKADPALTEIRTTITDRIDRLTTQAHTDGTLRPDVTPADIGRLMTLQIYAAPNEPYPTAVNRVLDLLLRGLHT
ncbi:TetR/AcrR family transcriptional regulator [Nocardia concava]|uniref:TetR/AcrR family transcriptional regulator n=1 Tax=Nocardia concava TaxID=257281 RepID=UPI00031740BA|nr:TetR/AcrR family transcriptional regulator [Nocardia concava]